MFNATNKSDFQKNKHLFPKLKKQIINYKQTARYLQEEIFNKQNVVPKLIKALNRWFTIMVGDCFC